MYSLVIMPGRSDKHESVWTVTDVQRLVGRIDLIPERIHGPGKSHQGHQCNAHTQKKSSRLWDEKEKQYHKAQPEPHHRRRPQKADKKHQQNTSQAAQEVEPICRKLALAFHQLSTELADRHKGKRGQKEDNRKQ